MADSYTTQSSTGFSQAVWDKSLIYPFEQENVFDAVATGRSTTEGGTRGKQVVHTYMNDLAVATTPIDEIIDPDAVTFTSSTKTFGLQEYGNYSVTTLLSRATSFADVDVSVARLIGVNAGKTMDTIAAGVLAGTANIQRANARTGNGTITATDTLTTKELEIAATQLNAKNVPMVGGNYWLFAHPYQIHDLRMEAGAGNWRESRAVGGNDFSALEQHTVGIWAGFRIVETTREPMTANVGAGSTVDVFKALAIGADALAKSYSDHPDAPGAYPTVVRPPSIDAFQRRHRIGWYHLVGYNILRDESVLAIYTAASLANNAS